MYDITVGQVKDDDDEIITTAATDPEALSVSARTTGEIIDVYVDTKQLRSKGADVLGEVFVACAQAAFAHRYDPLLDTIKKV